MKASPVLAGLALLLAMGCEERITGPEAVQIVRALDEGLSNDSVLRDFWLAQAMGGGSVLGPLWRSSAATTTAIVQRDDTPVEYQAIVLERITIPPHGVADSSVCRFTEIWTLLLWRHSNPAEGVVFEGQRFDQPMGTPSPPCAGRADWADLGPFLWMTRLPPNWREDPQMTHRFGWLARGGTGDISPGKGSGDCGFTAEDVRILMEDLAVTCRRTTHRVRFHAIMAADSHMRQPTDPAMQRFALDLPETEVAGVQYTIHCDERPKTELCHP